MKKGLANVLGIVLLTIGGFAILSTFNQVLLAGVLVVGLIIGMLSLKWPSLATVAVMFAIYTNIPGVVANFHHVPQLAAYLVIFLLIVPLFDRLIVKREAIIFDRIFLLMLLYLAAMLASMIVSKDLGVAAASTADYVLEGIVVYFLADNVVRDLPTLKRVVAAVLLAGGLMGGLSVFQNLTHTLNNNYGGFAQTGGVFRVGRSFGKGNPQRRSARGSSKAVDPVPRGFGEGDLQQRSAGPIGEQNFYAQTLVVLLPLCFLFFKLGRTRTARSAAVVAGCLILGGVGVTYSRGALVGLAVVVLALVAMRYLKVSQLAFFGLAGALALAAMSSDITGRIQSFREIPELLVGSSSTEQHVDESWRHRFALNIAAFEVFAEHPLIGVGPGQFAHFYSTPVVIKDGLAFQEKGFYAHNCYLGIAADFGIFGLLAFLAIAGILLHGLYSRWRRWRWDYPDLALLAASFFLGCTAFFVTAIFLQLAYQRYFWLLVALASSAMRVTDEEAGNRHALLELNRTTLTERTEL